MKEDEAKLEVVTEQHDRNHGFYCHKLLAVSLVLAMDHTKKYLAN